MNRQGSVQNWLPTIIGVIIVVLIGGGILAWQDGGLLKPTPTPSPIIAVSPVQNPTLAPILSPKATQIPQISIKSPDRLSIEIYKDNRLIRAISRQEIIDQFKIKYGENVGSPGVYMEPYVFSVFLGPLKLNKDFFYSSELNRIILPLILMPVSGSMNIADFFFYDINSNQFSIAPGLRGSTNDDYVGRISTFPNKMVISPNERYLAYASGSAGGTCVADIRPKVIDFNDFSDVLDSTGLEAILKTIPASYYPITVKNIQWLSNQKIKVTMSFGMRGCGKYMEKTIELPIIR